MPSLLSTRTENSINNPPLYPGLFILQKSGYNSVTNEYIFYERTCLNPSWYRLKFLQQRYVGTIESVSTLSLPSIRSTENTFSEGMINMLDNYDLLKSKYRVLDEKAVFSFLERNRDLLPFLFDTFEKIKTTFPSYDFVELAYKNEPEIFDTDGLFAYVYTDLDINTALSKSDELEITWFFDNYEKTQGRFIFDVRCR